MPGSLETRPGDGAGLLVRARHANAAGAILDRHPHVMPAAVGVQSHRNTLPRACSISLPSTNQRTVIRAGGPRANNLEFDVGAREARHDSLLGVGGANRRDRAVERTKPRLGIHFADRRLPASSCCCPASGGRSRSPRRTRLRTGPRRTRQGRPGMCTGSVNQCLHGIRAGSVSVVTFGNCPSR